ncbi:MAG: formamidopyrimidine-DNA glycosylase [Thermoguttaceae bacterium]|nr:formamidopyrimidine-DNA glycosylase [Thermoguttaceae bacterium]MDW8077940.1 DNA-formamidopyrimidine glycosylase family protein [Thermoguttaceae bacterium]
MPELPEVETMRRHLLATVGARVVDIERPRSSLRPIKFRPSFPSIRKTAMGAEISAVERMGKRVVIRLRHPDDELALVIEPRMTGLLTLASPPDMAHTRMIIRLDRPERAAIHFWDARGLGVVALCQPPELERLSKRLGPDALSVTAAQLRASLCTSSRPIKLALMDQEVLAGVGNLYAAEILFHARIHPATPCSRLSPRAWHRLMRSIHDVLLSAIEAQGSTLADGTYRSPSGEAGRYQFSHYVYQKDGQSCLRCRRGVIARMKLGGRSTFYCPVCQPSL